MRSPVSLEIKSAQFPESQRVSNKDYETNKSSKDIKLISLVFFATAPTRDESGARVKGVRKKDLTSPEKQPKDRKGDCKIKSQQTS